MPLIKDLLGKILTGSGGDLIKSVTGVIDEVNLSKEEKAAIQQRITDEINRHNEAVLIAANEQEKAYLADVQNARDANYRIQDSDSASWLAKNIAYLIDCFVLLLWGFLTVYLMLTMLRIIPKQVGVDYTAVTAIWGAVGTYAGTIINFHRGSSIGSKKANDTLRDIAAG